MDKDLELLRSKAMGNLMLRVCKDHVYKDMIFFSEEEFEKYKFKIFEITGAHRRLSDKLKKLENGN